MKILKNYSQWENHKSDYRMFEAYTVVDGKLDVSEEGITSLNDLPEDLDILRCSDNYLRSLPELPKKLTQLYCTYNKLTSLPELPDTLKYLYCYQNVLRSLPELPESLALLDCTDNQLTELPELPESLFKMMCYHNPLECLIPNKFLIYQDGYWLNNFYVPFINSYDGQKKILTKQPNMVKQLEEQTKIHPKIREEFKYLFTGIDLNLL